MSIKLILNFIFDLRIIYRHRFSRPNRCNSINIQPHLIDSSEESFWKWRRTHLERVQLFEHLTSLQPLKKHRWIFSKIYKAITPCLQSPYYYGNWIYSQRFFYLNFSTSQHRVVPVCENEAPFCVLDKCWSVWMTQMVRCLWILPFSVPWPQTLKITEDRRHSSIQLRILVSGR